MEHSATPLIAVEKELRAYRDNIDQWKAARGYAVRALSIGQGPEDIKRFLKSEAVALSPEEIRSKAQGITTNAGRMLWSQTTMKEAGWTFIPADQRMAMSDPAYQAVFTKGNRIVLPLKKEADPHQQKVQEWLVNHGYQLKDYANGIATKPTKNGKAQEFRIGKLLQADPDGKALLKGFENRSIEKLRVVISRDPVDIMRISTGREWVSCMASDGSNNHYVPRDLKQGTLAAYVVSADDPTILRPKSRLLLKPYQDGQGRTILVADKVYGLGVHGFRETVDDWLDAEFNQGKEGRFTLRDGLYEDGVGSTMVRHSPMTRQLFKAIREKDVATAREAIKAGAKVNARDKHGNTPLHVAAVWGHTEVVKALLEAGADVHARDNGRYTALHVAAERGHTEVLTALLEAGADVNARDYCGWTALHVAAERGHTEVLTALLEAGADVHARDNGGQTALHWAARDGDTEAVKALLEAGADVHARDNGRYTALHVAAERGRTEVVEALLEAGADVHARDDGGQTALHRAAGYGHTEAVKLLQEHERKNNPVCKAWRRLADWDKSPILNALNSWRGARPQAIPQPKSPGP